MIKLDQALAGVSKLGFDTPPIIYFIETHPQYDALVTEVFRHIAGASFEGFTSVITLSEVLVQPLRHANTRLQQTYRDILIRTRNFRTPDALQLAAVLSAGCQAFLTNDAALQRVTELRVLVLDELEL